jgi:1-acyl-sn-glycerol-3-phosphate acyltransferase
MAITAILVNSTVKHITRLICRVDDEQLAQIPQHGPLILVTNHINFLDVPLVYTHLIPRRVTGFAKSETWDNPFLRPLFNLWGAIPLRRGEADIPAVKKCLKALEAGYIIGIAPEGTRSGHGRLQRGHPGVVTIAMRSQAPVIPLAYYGSECFRNNISRLKRTDFHIKVGRPFRLKALDERTTKDTRLKISDEIMYQLAELLPAAYRGVYSDLSIASTNYLEFISPTDMQYLSAPDFPGL